MEAGVAVAATSVYGSITRKKEQRVGVLSVRASACLSVVCITGVLGCWPGLSGGVALADGRAYEMVSPPDKNGGDVMATSARVRTATDGSAATYASLSASGDVMGTGVATEYMSVRTAAQGTRGWSTHAISPPQPPLTYVLLLFGFETMYQGAFSSDLTQGVVRAWSPLTDAPDVAHADNLYRRDDLRTPGTGRYQLVTDCPACTTPFPDGALFFYGVPHLADASSDFGHVLFSSMALLAQGGTEFNVNAYEWDNGAVRLAGVLPDGTPAPSSVAGGDFDFATFLAERSISDDGRKIFFSAPADVSSANLYMRSDGISTVQINASERTPADFPQPARFWDASDDGSRVYFTTQEALTDDAPANGDRKLYVYDTTKPEGDPHNLTYVNVDNEPGDTSNDVQAVVGASADGSTVYFVTSGQLVAGRPLISFGLFAWHDGVVSYVSEIPSASIPKVSRESNAFKEARVAANGDLLFPSNAEVGPTGYDHGLCGGGPCRELYLYRIGTHRLSCVSCNPTGAPATADATVVVQRGEGGSQRVFRETHAVTDDGEHVFFSTAEALVPEDRNNTSDAYEYDAASSAVRLISSGRSSSPSYVMDVTPDGRDVFFVTRERLVGWDVDASYDLYDARVGGGFPDPPVPTEQCSGEPCQGMPAAPLDTAGTSSSLFSGHGNERASLHKRGVKGGRRCNPRHIRRKVHGHVRCVRRNHRHRRHTAATHARSESQRRSR